MGKKLKTQTVAAQCHAKETTTMQIKQIKPTISRCGQIDANAP